MNPREQRGRLVRDTWVMWARQQPNPKPGWLTGWNELDYGQRQVDMLIGDAVAADALLAFAAELEAIIMRSPHPQTTPEQVRYGKGLLDGAAALAREWARALTEGRP